MFDWGREGEVRQQQSISTTLRSAWRGNTVRRSMRECKFWARTGRFPNEIERGIAEITPYALGRALGVSKQSNGKAYC